MIAFRDAAESDRAELIGIWNRSFGDPDKMVADFLNHFGTGTGLVGVEDGKILCAAYILPTDGIYLPGVGSRSCCYIYAVAVLPEYRGGGIGREITKAAVSVSIERGFEFSVLKPSDAGLFGFYRKLGFSDFTYVNEQTFYKKDIPAPYSNNKTACVSPEEYLSLRERVLFETVHIIPSRAEIAYQSTLGKLFGLTLGESCGCAAVEQYGDTAYIKELLVPANEIPAAVALISEAVPASVYKVNTPVYDESKATSNGMIYPELEIKQKKPFLGLAFD